MIRPQLKHLLSPDLEEPALPSDPAHCRVALQALIGPDDGPGEESFAFEVVTRSYVDAQSRTQWGRGFLILDSFDWNVVHRYLDERLSKAGGDSWDDVATQLNTEMRWEFDNYRPYVDRGE